MNNNGRDLENKLVKVLADRYYENHLKKLDERELKSRLHDLKDNLRIVITEQYNLYKKTGNPLYIWDAYSRCRDWKLPVPDWIYEYFDQCSNNLMDHWDSPPTESATSIAKSLNMVSPGRGSVFTETSKRDQNIALFMELSLLVDPKLKPDQLYDSMAKSFDVSRSTVQRAWTEWGERKRNS